MVHRSGRLWLAFATLLAGSAQAASSSSLSLSASPNPAVYGTAVTLTATVAPATATGKVTFYQGLSVVGIASLSSGKATLTTTSLVWGKQPLNAYYAGDGTFGSSTSAALPMVVNSVAAQGFRQTVMLPHAGLQFPALASGDFNGDGKMDVAATGAVPGATSLAIFLGKGDGTFSAGPTYPGIVQASSIVAADFNGDGKTDLAIMDDGASTLRVRLGNGDGSFQAAVNYSVSGYRLVTGDFNGDGIVDIATTQPAYSNSSVSLLLGKGDGTFAAPVSSPVPGGANTLVAADVNGDGIADLVILQGSSNVEVFLGRGDGTFVQTGGPITLDHQVVDVASGDFNHDGKTDLVVSNGTGVSLLLGNGGGTFLAPEFFAVGRPAYTLCVTDVNGDGNPDVIVGTGYPDPTSGVWGSFAVLLGDGAGSLQLNAFHDTVASSGRFVIGDFNGDGRVDIVESLGADLATYLGLAPTDLSVTLTHSGDFRQGQSGAAFTSTVSNLGPAPTSGQVTIDYGLPASLTLVQGSGSGWDCSPDWPCTRTDPLAPGASYPPVTLKVNVSISAPASVTGTATVSIDGQSDPNPTNDAASDSVTIVQYQTIVFGTLPDLVFGAPPFTLTATATSGLPVGYTASGNCTLNASTVTLTAVGSCTITAGQAGNSLYLPAPGVARTFIIGSAATSVGLSVAPVDATFGAPVTLTATVNPGAATGRVTFYDGTTVLGNADLTQGVARLTVRPAGTGLRRIYARYGGTAPWPGSISHAAGLTVTAVPAFNFTASMVSGSMVASDVAVGDFNGDGMPDIIASSEYFIAVLPGDGTGHFGSPIQTTVSFAGLNVTHVAVGDFNGDGKLDVAVTAATQSQAQNVSVWLGRGDGTFAPGPVFAIPGTSLAVADFNGDGFADLAIGHGPAPGVSVLLNKRDGTFESPIEYSVSGDGNLVLLAVADVNRDGNVDLIAVTGVHSISDNINNRVNLLLGRGDGTFLQPAGWVDDPAEASTRLGAIALGDLNGDGIPDVVIENDFSYVPYRCSITALIGNGDGTFQPPSRYLCSQTALAVANGQPAGLLIGDFTGDGKADVAALYTSGILQLFPGNGDGTFQSASVYAYSGVTGVSTLAMADFNGDGRVDFVSSRDVAVLAGAPGPSLRISTASTGPLTSGQTYAYTISIANAQGASTTTGTVTVTDNAPGYTNLLSMAGTGWTCGPNNTCLRSDPLTAGASYPPIAVQIGIDLVGGVLPMTNTAVVSGGGSPPAESVRTLPLRLPGTPLITAVETVGGAPASFPYVSSNDWIEIHGINLVPANTPAAGVVWSNAPEFASGKMPTQLNGVSVTVNGKPAYVEFYCSAATSPACSTDQINVLSPLDDSPPPYVQIVVTSGAGTSSGFDEGALAVSPAFLRFGASRYVAATHADYSLVGPSTLYPGLSTPAKHGEVAVLWAVGFGFPAGNLTPDASSQSGVMPENPKCTVGGNPANVLINLVSPGLYQLNVTVPPEARSGDNPLTCIYRSTATPDGTLLAIE